MFPLRAARRLARGVLPLAEEQGPAWGRRTSGRLEGKSRNPAPGTVGGGGTGIERAYNDPVTGRRKTPRCGPSRRPVNVPRAGPGREVLSPVLLTRDKAWVLPVTI